MAARTDLVYISSHQQFMKALHSVDESEWDFGEKVKSENLSACQYFSLRVLPLGVDKAGRKCMKAEK